MKKRKILIDVVFNIIASVIPIAVLQLFILPRVSKIVGDDIYGFLVTIVAIMNLVPATLGNVLNNVRLIKGKEIGENSKNDFQLFFLFSLVSDFIAVSILTIFYSNGFDLLSFVLIVCMSFFWLAHEYYIVTYRITLNFLFILIDNIILSIGFAVGYFSLKYWCFPWQTIFIFGYLFSFVFIFFTSKLVKEKITKTNLFKTIGIDFLLLLIANLIARSIGYVDRLILYPILGGALVSVYYSASIFSKVMALAVTPLTSVLLSYLSKLEKIKNKTFLLSIILSASFSAVICAFSILLARPVLTFLYPEYVESAINYVPMLSLAMFFSTIISVVNPFVLKFCKIKWQIVLNSIVLIIYLVLCLSLLSSLGLTGFCIGSAITYFIKLAIQISIYFFTRKKEKRHQIDDDNSKCNSPV